MRFLFEECGRCGGAGMVDCIYCGGRGIKSPHGQVCRVCHGTGKQPCSVCFIDETCGRCGGTGVLDCIYCGGMKTKSPHNQICRVCHGTGKQPCGVCQGAYWAREEDKEDKLRYPRADR